MHSYTTRILALGLLFAFPTSLLVTAQTGATESKTVKLTSAQLQELVAPIALYPDPMLALILPASTVPTDIVVANRFGRDGKDASLIDQQNWDDSVKGLARYPEVLQKMDENLDWTNQLGAAVLAQQDDVMNAIQAMRKKAQDLGNLQTTPQQTVVVEKEVIQIVPANPQVIYVPTYSPQVVYVERSPVTPLITFGAGLALGVWIGGGCDWHQHGIYYNGYYRPGYGWGPSYNSNNNVNININNNNNNVNVWRPNPNKPQPRPPYNPDRPSGQVPGWNKPSGVGVATAAITGSRAMETTTAALATVVPPRDPLSRPRPPGRKLVLLRPIQAPAATAPTGLDRPPSRARVCRTKAASTRHHPARNAPARGLRRRLALRPPSRSTKAPSSAPPNRNNPRPNAAAVRGAVSVVPNSRLIS